MNKIGIDEAGRGPVAGPLSLAAVMIEGRLDIAGTPLDLMVDGIYFKDSKKLTEKRREKIFDFILSSEQIKFTHCFISAKEIDDKGMSSCLVYSIDKTVSELNVKTENIEIFLDGSLSVPNGFKGKTLVKGDERVFEIALASVVAKVLRDKYMIRLSKTYPKYSFEKHKGYGTKLHIEAIKSYGPTKEHRLSFLSKII